MKEVYVTPNGQWKVLEQNNPEWQSIFGKTPTYFNVVRANDGFLVYSGGNLKSVFEWLSKRMIISKDEAKHQIKLLENGNETSAK